MQEVGGTAIPPEVFVDLLLDLEGQVALQIPLHGLADVPHHLSLHVLLVICHCLPVISDYQSQSLTSYLQLVADDAHGADCVVKSP